MGMGKELYEKEELRSMFEMANGIVGFRISDIMFSGTDEDLKQTSVTQPAIFLHSTVLAASLGNDFQPEAVAGHSLGEFSALVAAGALSFEDGLRLVVARANAMQKACEANPSTMAAIIGLPDEKVEEVCASISDEIVVPANYNCPGQLVISGSMDGIQKTCELLKAAGARRALPLKVGGAFHSPLMESARMELSDAIEKTRFGKPFCPIYQNVDAQPTADPETIKRKLIAQLTSPVRWTATVQNMVAEGFDTFVEVGPGTVLQGLVRKVKSDATLISA